MSSSHPSRPFPVVGRVTLLALAALGVVALGGAPASAAVPAQAVSGTEVAKFIRTEWWPEARTSVEGSDVGYETLPLTKVRCPRTVPAVTGDSQEVLAAAIVDLAAGDVAASVDRGTGVFTCVALLDRQPLLIGGAISESGDAHFATASLMLSPSVLADAVADELRPQIGGTAQVVCSRRAVLVAQPDVPVRCKVVAPDDASRGIAEVTLDGGAAIESVDFTEK